MLSDYNLPGFSGLVALDLLKASGRDIPFILVSGEIGEDTAVEAMRNGASDYLLKNNLARLVPAIRAVRFHVTEDAASELKRYQAGDLHIQRPALFVRTPAGMLPTPRADELIVPTRQALEAMRSTREWR